MDSVQDKVEEVEIPQKHIEALERINAITVMDRLSYNVHKQSKNAEEVSDICTCCISDVSRSCHRFSESGGTVVIKW